MQHSELPGERRESRDVDDLLNGHYQTAVGDLDHFFANEWHFLRRVYAEVGSSAGSQLLDVCCGVGAQAVAAARYGYRVIGIDYSLTGIQTAASRARAQGVKSWFVVADCQAMPFRHPLMFDMVQCLGNALLLQPSRAAAELLLATLVRLTRIHGRIVVGVRPHEINDNWRVEFIDSGRNSILRRVLPTSDPDCHVLELGELSGSPSVRISFRRRCLALSEGWMNAALIAAGANPLRVYRTASGFAYHVYKRAYVVGREKHV
jgi:SAM-dependent methyltransferase